jgi:mercuric ion transport protein
MSEPQNGRGALFAGGLAAILASACCLGPLVLIALGFSGAWIGNLTVLEPYRPIFIGAALVALFSPGGASTARRKPANRVRSARFPKCELLTSSFSGSWPRWSWSRSDFPTSCHFSIKGFEGQWNENVR